MQPSSRRFVMEDAIQNLTGVDTLSFDTTYTGGSTAPGMVAWNDLDGTLEFQLKGGNVTLQIGQEQVVRVKNNTGSTIPNGSAVYISGSDGNNLRVAMAQANSEISSASTIGIATEDLVNAHSAYVTTFGLVRDINTSGLTEGAPVWLSATTPGALTSTRPSAPNHGVMLGFCLRQSSTNGVIFVRVDNGWELDELHDVNITSPADNDVLTYNSSTGVWQNSGALNNGYRFVQTVAYTSSGTFTKATYPWLRAIRVRCLGGGGGGGFAATTAASQNAIGAGGGGGAYAETFITDVSGLASSVTVTVGNGGSGGVGGTSTAATAGGASSFGSLAIAAGGSAGSSGLASSVPASAAGVGGGAVASSTGDIIIPGESSESRFYWFASTGVNSRGGGSALYPQNLPASAVTTGTTGSSATSTSYGVGGNGGINLQSQATARNGGAGAQGIVYVELYA